MDSGERSISSERRSLFRIVRTNPPTRDDFLSYRALGLRPPASLSVDQLRQWEGISVFATENQARRQARRYPHLGTSIAELVIVPNLGLEVRRTNPRSPGHHTLWGDPADIARAVARVVPVEDLT
jgi:hypothetical protein